MTATSLTSHLDPGKPLNLNDSDFVNNKYEYYKWLREYSPVHVGKVSVIKIYLLSRYEDCLSLMKDPRFLRNRSTITGGGKFPFPLPKSMSLVADSMIIEDDPEHKRLRNLVQKAFAPKVLRGMEESIEAMTHELLDAVEGQDSFELKQAYALPIPVNVIGRLVGVSQDLMPRFRDSIRYLSEGFSGWSMLRTVAFDIPKAVKLVREMIAEKRANPADDILTGLIEAEEEGDRLSENELISMIFLLIIAGFETTVHLISNGVIALTQHPEQMARLRSDPELYGSAVEEILRFNGPLHGTKMTYAREDIELHGVTIPKGASVMPLLGAANHDPEVFANPEVFDIARTPNRHLGFSQGNHFCLGAFLARMETKIALKTLIERYPNLQLAVPIEELKLQKLPGWHRYQEVHVSAVR